MSPGFVFRKRPRVRNHWDEDEKNNVLMKWLESYAGKNKLPEEFLRVVCSLTWPV